MCWFSLDPQRGDNPGAVGENPAAAASSDGAGAEEMSFH